MSDADFAQLLADLTRMAARLAEMEARELVNQHPLGSLATPREMTGRA